jgi:geranylgeranyl diphosphate synthase type II
LDVTDDILNLVGEHEKYGKEIGGDIWEGKRTMMLIHVLHRGTRAEKARLRGFLATPRERRLQKDIEWVYELMVKHKSVEFAHRNARQLAEAALGEFATAYGGLPDTKDKAFLNDIVLYMIERDL